MCASQPSRALSSRILYPSIPPCSAGSGTVPCPWHASARRWDLSVWCVGLSWRGHPAAGPGLWYRGRRWYRRSPCLSCYRCHSMPAPHSGLPYTTRKGPSWIPWPPDSCTSLWSRDSWCAALSVPLGWYCPRRGTWTSPGLSRVLRRCCSSRCSWGWRYYRSVPCARMGARTVWRRWRRICSWARAPYRPCSFPLMPGFRLWRRSVLPPKARRSGTGCSWGCRCLRAHAVQVARADAMRSTGRVCIGARRHWRWWPRGIWRRLLSWGYVSCLQS